MFSQLSLDWTTLQKRHKCVKLYDFMTSQFHAPFDARPVGSFKRPTQSGLHGDMMKAELDVMIV